MEGDIDLAAQAASMEEHIVERRRKMYLLAERLVNKAIAFEKKHHTGVINVNEEEYVDSNAIQAVLWHKLKSCGEYMSLWETHPLMESSFDAMQPSFRVVLFSHEIPATWYHKFSVFYWYDWAKMCFNPYRNFAEIKKTK